MVCNYVCHFVWTNEKLSNFRTGDRKSYMGEKRFCERCQNIGIGTKTYHNTIADLVNYENKHWWTLMDCKLSKMKCKKSWLEIFFFFWKPCCTHMKSLWFTWWFVFFINTTFTHTHTVTHTQAPSLSLNIKYTSAVSSRSDWCDESVKLLWQLMMTSVCVCLAFLMHCRFLCFCSTTGVCSLKVKDKSCERSHHWNETSCYEMVWIFMIQVALVLIM